MAGLRVRVTVTRDYGETATEKSRELLLHILIATLGVDRPWDGTLPPAVPDGEGIFRMRALLGFAAAVVLGIYAVRLGRTPTHHP